MKSQRIWVVLFGGAGRESIIFRLLDLGVEIGAVVVPAKRSPRLDRAIASVKQHDLPLIEASRQNLAEKLMSFSGHGLLSIGFPYIIPNRVYSRFEPALNVHPTLLPKYRGPTTGAYIILNGERETGSTVHHMTDDMDRGAVVAQSRVSISAFDTIRSMQRKVYEAEPDLVSMALAKVESGAIAEPQDEALASEYPKRRRPEDSEIDPQKPLIDLINEIRASDPDDFPAYFYYHGERVCVRLWRPEKDAASYDEI